MVSQYVSKSVETYSNGICVIYKSVETYSNDIVSKGSNFNCYHFIRIFNDY